MLHGMALPPQPNLKRRSSFDLTPYSMMANLEGDSQKQQAQDLDAEVNVIAGEVALGPAAIAVFDDKVGIGGQRMIVRLLRDDLETALLEQREQWRQTRGAGLFAGPAGRFKSICQICQIVSFSL